MERFIRLYRNYTEFENSSIYNRQYIKNGVTYTTTESPKEVEKEHIKMFENLIKKASQLSGDIIEKGAWKKGETKIF